jgi:cell division septal protein FtsQ
MSPTTTRDRPPSDGQPSDGPPSDGQLRERTPIDPRISARRTEVTRQVVRRRVRLLGALLAAAVLAFGVWSLLHTSLFSASAVTVVGATHESKAQIEAAAGLTSHPPLLDVNAGAVEQRIDRLPWVRASLVTVHWPDGVRVVVSEQVAKLVMPVAGGRWAELDGQGRVLAVVAVRPAALVEVTGPRAPGDPGSTLAAPDRIGLDVAATLPVSFRAQVTAVNVEPQGWVQLTMTTPILVNIGDTSQLREKYEDVSTMLAHVALHDGDTIDVSVPGAPTVTGP